MKKMPCSIYFCASYYSPFCSYFTRYYVTWVFIRSEWSLSVHKANNPSIWLTEEKQSHVEEPKIFPYNKYESPPIVSLKTNDPSSPRSNDGSWSIPSPFHHYSQALLSRKNLSCTFFFANTWSKTQSGVVLCPLLLRSASPLFHLSLSFFSFCPLLSLFSQPYSFKWLSHRFTVYVIPDHSDLKSVFEKGDTQTLSSLSSLSLITTIFFSI